MELLYKNETYVIRGAIFDVYNEIGSGYAKSVYLECLEREFAMREIAYERNKPVNIIYKHKNLRSAYVADFICFDKVVLDIVVEPRSVKCRRAAMINNLRLLNKRIGFLVNFGLKPKVEIVRVIV